MDQAKQWRNIGIALGALIFIGVLAALLFGGGKPSQPGAQTPAQGDTASAAPTPDTCDSQDAKDLVKSAIENSATSKLIEVKVLDMGAGRELYFDKAKNARYCQADGVLNTGDTPLSYKLYFGPSGPSAGEIVSVIQEADGFDTSSMISADASAASQANARTQNPTPAPATNSKDPTTPAADQPPTNPPDTSTAAPEPAVPAAPPADTVMTSRFGNTEIVRNLAANTEWHLYFVQDGTFTATEKRSNYRTSGTWSLDGATVCLSFQPALPRTPNPDCKAVDPHQLGDSWTANGSLFTLAPGVQ